MENSILNTTETATKPANLLNRLESLFTGSKSEVSKSYEMNSLERQEVALSNQFHLEQQNAGVDSMAHKF